MDDLARVEALLRALALGSPAVVIEVSVAVAVLGLVIEVQRRYYNAHAKLAEAQREDNEKTRAAADRISSEVRLLSAELGHLREAMQKSDARGAVTEAEVRSLVLWRERMTGREEGEHR